ncbi:TonB-dependent receptor plug domain-containing protein [Sphingomonas sp. ID1715]|uniref:TonB-dependent receptor n=1 Tax=Sphingomonas sp. ID1715 TaxID=1656898 RepID=UPI001488BC28|nr:TonB-dependent receptor [Sphingomonas sp. ID1715]NNM76114.1 TonB-dependent receptor plug domain-containing protein [Sphingomonas sp. ID1715]
MRNHLFIGAAVAALIAPAAVQAQETTSTIRGSVTSGGAAVAGAAVEITHVPSGSRSTVTTDASGSFNAGGLRVGGPFSVKVTAPGYPDFTVTDIFTVIAQAYDLPIELTAETASTGEDIVVTASSIVNAGTISQGPATVLTSEQIDSVASLNRDVRDLMRRDPFARLDDTPSGGRAVSFAGQNARFNRFSIDGVPVTDNFGLNPDGLPTRRSPVPFDAIGQFQTKVAPFDVREGNFQGGAINAILKSGTNEFHGTGFYAYSADELTGKKTKAGPGVPTGRVNLPNFKFENYGGQISGPIIPDRLFFMVAGERIRAGTPIPEGTPGNNAGTVVPNISDAVVAQIQSIAQNRYGYDTGGVLNDSGDKDDRLVAKIDANLSDSQRASLTYLYTKDSIRFNQNTQLTGITGLGLESNGYVSSNRLHTGVFQLNSDWSDAFSTEVRAFYKDYKRGQDPILGRGFAQFQVCTAPTSDRATGTGTANDLSTACQAGNGVVSFGPDISRQSNSLTSRTYGGLVQARLTQGDHDLRIFAEYQNTKIFNLFLQRTAGDYYFDSLADFAAGNAQRFRYQNAVPSLDPADAAARFTYKTYVFGIQDTWQVTPEFTLAYGARYDMYGGSSRPALNQNFTNRYGFTNQAYISGRGVFQPRIGFDYKPTSDIAIRGGIGIFAGGSPDVYISNSFSNTGFLSSSIDVIQRNNGTYTGATADQATAILTNVDGDTIPGAANAVVTNVTSSANAPTNALDPNFKLPSQWRGTLSVDWTPDLSETFLGDNWTFGADFLYSAVRNQVFFTDLRVRPTALRTPDGRVRYAPITSFTDTQSDLFLTNTKLGRSYIGVARIQKSWDFGLSAFVSYVYQDVKDQAPATSSTASSNYGNGAFFDANGAAYGISNDQVKHNIKYNLSFDHAFFGDYKTNITLFGETRIGRPYSYTMQDTATRSTVFGTIGNGARYLLYVPTGTSDPLVSYDSAATQTYLDNLINTTGLGKYRGKVAPRNAFNSKWFTKFDLHLHQEIPTGLGDSRITLFADIENVTNLINKNWGQIREYQFPYTIAAVRVQCLQAPVATGTAPGTAVATNTSQACAQYRYLSPNSVPTDSIYSRQSLYSIRVGARITF